MHSQALEAQLLLGATDCSESFSEEGPLWRLFILTLEKTVSLFQQ